MEYAGKPKREKTRYKVMSIREVPIEGRSWSAKVDIEIECPMDAVLETRVVDIKVRAIEASPGSKANMKQPKQLSMEGTP